MPDISERSTRGGLMWLVTTQVVVFSVGFGGSVILARLLSPREMGVYAIAAAAVGVLAVVRATGLNNFLIREPKLTAAIIATAFTCNLVLAMASSVILLTLGKIGANGLGGDEIASVMRVLALSPLLSVFEFLPTAYLERTGQIAVVSFVNLARGIVNTSVTLALAYFGQSFMSIAWGNVAGACFAAGVMACQPIPFSRFQLCISEWRVILKFGSQMMTLSIFGSISEKLFDVMLGKFVGLDSLGIYARASGLNGMIWDNLHLLIGRIVLVDFSERCRRGLPLRDIYLRVYSIVITLLWPAFIGISILSKPIVMNLYGEKWISASLPLSLLSMASVVYTLVTMTWELYIVRGEGRAQLVFQLRKTFLGILLYTIGCLSGLLGAACSRIADALLSVILARRDIERMTDTKTSDYFPLLVQSFWLTLLACSPCFIYMCSQSWSPHANVSGIAMCISLGVAFWSVALRAINHPLQAEVSLLVVRFSQTVVPRLKGDFWRRP